MVSGLSIASAAEFEEIGSHLPYFHLLCYPWNNLIQDV